MKLTYTPRPQYILICYNLHDFLGYQWTTRSTSNDCHATCKNINYKYVTTLCVTTQPDKRRACRTVSGRWDRDIDSSARFLAVSDPADWQTICPCTPDTTSVDSGNCGTVTWCQYRQHSVVSAWCMLQPACNPHTGPAATQYTCTQLCESVKTTDIQYVKISQLCHIAMWFCLSLHSFIHSSVANVYWSGTGLTGTTAQ